MRNGKQECTVLIPSYGPAVHLLRVLDALEQQTHDSFEVIVVDNNPVQRLAFVAARRPRFTLRVLHEPLVGLSRARNAAVDNARSHYVAFLDDDTIPDNTWLEHLLRGLRLYEAAAAGGSIRLAIEGNAPTWLGPEQRRLLAELLYDNRDIPSIRQHQYICGGNMAFAKATFVQQGGFSETFGRVGRVLRSSEELDWCRRLQSAGAPVAFIAGAQVAHVIREERLHLRYFLTRALWQGRSDALLENEHGRPSEFGRRSTRRNLTECASRLIALAGARDTKSRGVEAIALARELGFGLEYELLRRKRRA